MNIFFLLQSMRKLWKCRTFMQINEQFSKTLMNEWMIMHKHYSLYFVLPITLCKLIGFRSCFVQWRFTIYFFFCFFFSTTTTTTTGFNTQKKNKIKFYPLTQFKFVLWLRAVNRVLSYIFIYFISHEMWCLANRHSSTTQSGKS